jgi:hypothetical protein
MWIGEPCETQFSLFKNDDGLEEPKLIMITMMVAVAPPKNCRVLHFQKHSFAVYLACLPPLLQVIVGQLLLLKDANN